MSGPVEWVVEPFSHGFMQHALLAIVLVGVICGVIGTFVTLRGLAFMGDAIAHAIFPGVVIAFVLGYASIAWLLKFVSHHSMDWFALYRVLLGSTVLGLLITGTVAAT